MVSITRCQDDSMFLWDSFTGHRLGRLTATQAIAVGMLASSTERGATGPANSVTWGTNVNVDDGDLGFSVPTTPCTYSRRWSEGGMPLGGIV